MKKYLVSCALAEGKHTGQLIAKKLDRIIESLDLSDDVF
jgi:hypothetical protein